MKSARSSQVWGSGREPGFLGELIESLAVVAGGGGQDAGFGRVGIGEMGQAGKQEPGVDVAEQHGVVQFVDMVPRS